MIRRAEAGRYRFFGRGKMDFVNPYSRTANCGQSALAAGSRALKWHRGALRYLIRGAGTTGLRCRQSHGCKCQWVRLENSGRWVRTAQGHCPAGMRWAGASAARTFAHDGTSLQRAAGAAGTGDPSRRYPVDHRRAGMRRRFDLHHGRHAAQHRRHRAAGAIPGLPAGHAASSGAGVSHRRRTFSKPYHEAAAGKLGPFILVIEGSIPDETQQGRRILGRLRHRRHNRPADHDLPMDRLAGAAGLGRRGLRHLRHLWRHSRHARQSDRLHGTGRLSGLELAVAGRHSAGLRAGLPGPARQLHGSGALPAESGGGPGAR